MIKSYSKFLSNYIFLSDFSKKNSSNLLTLSPFFLVLFIYIFVHIINYVYEIVNFSMSVKLFGEVFRLKEFTVNVCIFFIY